MLSASSLRRFLVRGGQPRRTQGKCYPEIRRFVRRRRIVEKIGVSNVVIDGRKLSERPFELFETVQFIFESDVLISL